MEIIIPKETLQKIKKECNCFNWRILDINPNKNLKISEKRIKYLKMFCDCGTFKKYISK